MDIGFTSVGSLAGEGQHAGTGLGETHHPVISAKVTVPSEAPGTVAANERSRHNVRGKRYPLPALVMTISETAPADEFGIAGHAGAGTARRTRQPGALM